MIRSSPCRKYLTFLLALGWSLEKIEDHCIELQLDYIDQAYLQKLLSDIARPKVFRPNDRRHAPSLLWLAEHGLSGLFPLPWVDAPREAFRHIQHRKAKEVIETLGLLRATPEKIVETLKLAKIQASVEGVSAALDLFWDLDILDQVELRALLELRLPSQAQLVDEDTAAKASAAFWRACITAPMRPPMIAPAKRIDMPAFALGRDGPASIVCCGPVATAERADCIATGESELGAEGMRELAWAGNGPVCAYW